MAIIVFTIHVSIAWLFALVAFRKYIICNSFTYTLIKHKVYTFKFTF